MSVLAWVAYQTVTSRSSFKTHPRRRVGKSVFFLCTVRSSIYWKSKTHIIVKRKVIISGHFLYDKKERQGGDGKV